LQNLIYLEFYFPRDKLKSALHIIQKTDLLGRKKKKGKILLCVAAVISPLAKQSPQSLVLLRGHI